MIYISHEKKPMLEEFTFNYIIGLTTTNIVDFLWVYKTSYHLLTSPIPSPHPITQQQKVTLERNKIDC